MASPLPHARGEREQDQGMRPSGVTLQPLPRAVTKSERDVQEMKGRQCLRRIKGRESRSQQGEPTDSSAGVSSEKGEGSRRRIGELESPNSQ